jgi:predicted negative regulator of RcsB-dependent stress response
MESKVADLPLSDKLLTWFETNKKPAAMGVVIAIVAGFVTWFLMNQHEQKETAASTALSSLVLKQPNSPLDRPASAEDYLKVAANYPGSSASGQALLLAAGRLFEENKFAEAKTEFERFMREHRNSPLVGQAAMGVAVCLDALGKTTEAENAYKDVIARHATENFVPQAKFALARIYEAQNKPELARDFYTQVSQSDSTFLGDHARLRVEDLTTKYPKLVPPVQSPTSPTFTIPKK